MRSDVKTATFRERFAELCSESEKTIVDLAKELHVSNQTISAWRIGTRSPKEPTIIAIANHFGVSVSWLMGFDVSRGRERDNIKSEEALTIARLVDHLSPQQRLQALNVLRAMYPEV